MGKSFDDLFNEFFNRRKNNGISINDEIKKIIDSLMNYKQVQSEMLSESIQEELGEADEIIDHYRGGLRYRKMIWNTPFGQFVKIIVSDENDGEEKPQKTKKETKSLEQQLKEAVEQEDYELAIQLRDEIKKSKRKTKNKK